MPKYLLDTHVLLWFQLTESKISRKVMDIIQNPDNEIFFSQLSLFEIVIKQTIGKLPELNSDADEIYHQAIKDSFAYLPFQNHHLYQYRKVELFPHHRDPFDRMLIATAYEESMPIITMDKNFSLYKGFIDIIW